MARYRAPGITGFTFIPFFVTGYYPGPTGTGCPSMIIKKKGAEIGKKTATQKNKKIKKRERSWKCKKNASPFIGGRRALTKAKKIIFFFSTNSI